MCAGDRLRRVGPCKGDTGSPLMYYSLENKRYLQIATVHGGVGECGDPDYPAIFIRLDHPSIINFIASIVLPSLTTNKIAERKTTRNETTTARNETTTTRNDKTTIGNETTTTKNETSTMMSETSTENKTTERKTTNNETTTTRNETSTARNETTTARNEITTTKNETTTTMPETSTANETISRTETDERTKITFPS
jgi:hypothetical protein